MKTPVLETDRLILRPVTLDDAPAIQKYFNNWNVVKHLSTSVPWPYPDDGAEYFVRNVLLPTEENGDSNTWAITLKENDDDALIGVVAYRSKDTLESGGNRGFWLGEPFWGNGYMTEAVIAVQDWLFFERGIESMKVANAKVNGGSRRVKEKTGATFLYNAEIPHLNGEKDAEIWEITAESWRKFRKG